MRRAPLYRVKQFLEIERRPKGEHAAFVKENGHVGELIHSATADLQDTRMYVDIIK